MILARDKHCIQSVRRNRMHVNSNSAARTIYYIPVNTRTNIRESSSQPTK